MTGNTHEMYNVTDEDGNFTDAFRCKACPWQMFSLEQIAEHVVINQFRVKYDDRNVVVGKSINTRKYAPQLLGTSPR